MRLTWGDHGLVGVLGVIRRIIGRPGVMYVGS